MRPKLKEPTKMPTGNKEKSPPMPSSSSANLVFKSGAMDPRVMAPTPNRNNPAQAEAKINLRLYILVYFGSLMVMQWMPPPPKFTASASIGIIFYQFTYPGFCCSASFAVSSRFGIGMMLRKFSIPSTALTCRVRARSK